MKRVKSEPVRQQGRRYGNEVKTKDLGFSIHPELLSAVRADALKFNVSCSFVINTALSITMGIDVGEKYWILKGEKPKEERIIHFRKRRSA